MSFVIGRRREFGEEETRERREKKRGRKIEKEAIEEGKGKESESLILLLVGWLENGS